MVLTSFNALSRWTFLYHPPWNSIYKIENCFFMWEFDLSAKGVIVLRVDFDNALQGELIQLTIAMTGTDVLFSICTARNNFTLSSLSTSAEIGLKTFSLLWYQFQIYSQIKSTSHKEDYIETFSNFSPNWLFYLYTCYVVFSLCGTFWGFCISSQNCFEILCMFVPLSIMHPYYWRELATPKTILQLKSICEVKQIFKCFS